MAVKATRKATKLKPKKKRINSTNSTKSTTYEKEGEKPKRKNHPKQEGYPSNELLRETIIKSWGRISVVSRLLHIDRTTIYYRIKKHQELQRAVKEARNFIVQFAEMKLMQNVAAGDQRAIEFVLKNKGKGWDKSAEQQQEGTKDLQTIISEWLAALQEPPPPLPEPMTIEAKAKHVDG